MANVFYKLKFPFAIGAEGDPDADTVGAIPSAQPCTIDGGTLDAFTTDPLTISLAFYELEVKNGRTIYMRQHAGYAPDSPISVYKEYTNNLINGYPTLFFIDFDYLMYLAINGQQDVQEALNASGTAIPSAPIKGKWRFGKNAVWGDSQSVLMDATIQAKITINGVERKYMTFGNYTTWRHDALTVLPNLCVSAYNTPIAFDNPSVAPVDYTTLVNNGKMTADFEQMVIDFGNEEQFLPAPFVDWVSTNATFLGAEVTNAYKVCAPDGVPVYAEVTADNAVGVSVEMLDDYKRATLYLADGTESVLQWLSNSPDPSNPSKTFLGLATTPQATVATMPLNKMTPVNFTEDTSLFEVYGEAEPVLPVNGGEDVSQKYYFDCGRMYLTEDALRENGIDLRAKMDGASEADVTVAIKNFCKRVSAILYAYIAKYSYNDAIQRGWIEHIASAQCIFYNALVAQAIYMGYGGDRSLGGTREDRMNAIDLVAMDELTKIIPELGCSLLYIGLY